LKIQKIIRPQSSSIASHLCSQWWQTALNVVVAAG